MGAGYRTSIGTGADQIPVVVVSGTPYEMGYSYGQVMASDASACLTAWLAFFQAWDPVHYSDANLDAAWATVEPYVPSRFITEMQGMAAGAGMSYDLVRRAHSITLQGEYQCSGVVLWGAASANGHLYQIRNLDYGLDQGLQDHPTIVVYLPTTGGAHANPCFAGYVGSIAGMSAAGIALTELGDSPPSDYPFDLNGVPFFVLFRNVLQDAGNFDDALAIFSGTRRIKRYWYCVGDGDRPAGAKIRALAPLGIYDVWFDNDPTDPLFPNVLPKVVYSTQDDAAAWNHLNANYGNYDANRMIELSQLVYSDGNLMDVVYDATARQMWVAYAEGSQPAYQRTYVHFDLYDYTLSVRAACNPATVGSGGVTACSATAVDGQSRGIASWLWDDGGVGGAFSPSASVQNPSYTAAANTSGRDRAVTLTVTATSNGPNQVSGADSATLTVQPVLGAWTPLGQLWADGGNNVTIEGNYAYCAGGVGLTIVDISTPSAPVCVGYYCAPGTGRDVAVSGQYAYLVNDATGVRGLRVLDISDPTHPFEVGYLNMPAEARGVAVVGHYAYVADTDGGFWVADVSDPANPVQVGWYGSSGWPVDLAVADGYAYLAEQWTGLRIMDLSDPTNPVPVGFWGRPGGAWDVCVAGGYAYVMAGGLRVIDISNPTNPIQVGYCATGGDGVVVSGGYAYVTAGLGGLRVVDVSNPATPFEVGWCDTLGIAFHAALSGGYAYVSDLDAGLQVIDVSSPTAPVQVGSWEGPSPQSMAIEGGYAFIAGRWVAWTIDVSDPTHLTKVGAWSMDAPTHGVTVSGPYAYLVDAYLRVGIYDVTDPANPIDIGLWNGPNNGSRGSGRTVGMVLSGPYLYICDLFGALWVLDVSNPTNPTFVACHLTPAPARWLAIAGQYAYVAADAAGLRVIDISDPAHPVEVGYCDTPGEAYGVALAGQYAYVADRYSGLRVIDISDPENPMGIAFCDTPGQARNVAVSGTYAYVADLRGGLRVIDISTPANPVEVASAEVPGGCRIVVVSGGYVYANGSVYAGGSSESGEEGGSGMCAFAELPPAVFRDVLYNHWARRYIEAIYRESITGGCSANPPNYCPTNTVTRGQMAVFLCKAAGKTPLNSPTPRFTDVPQTHPFYAWIERLADPDSWSGTPPTQGCTATEFCPTQATTRGQMAAFLCRATGQTPLTPGTPTFGDVADTHPFYGWIERLADPSSWTVPPTTGCAMGPPRLYCPTNTCKRGEMAVFLCRAFDIPY